VIVLRLACPAAMNPGAARPTAILNRLQPDPRTSAGRGDVQQPNSHVLGMTVSSLPVVRLRQTLRSSARPLPLGDRRVSIPRRRSGTPPRGNAPGVCQDRTVSAGRSAGDLDQRGAHLLERRGRVRRFDITLSCPRPDLAEHQNAGPLLPARARRRRIFWMTEPSNFPASTSVASDTLTTSSMRSQPMTIWPGAIIAA